MNRRVLCLSLPDLVLQTTLLSHPELRGRPVVIGGAPSEPRPVLACSPEAERYGVRPGMRLKEAQSYCPHAIFLPEMPAQVHALMVQLGARLEEISPVVEAAADGLFWIALDGLGLLWPDEAALAAPIKALVVECGPFRLHIGIADTKYAATVAALEGDLLIVPPGQDARYLAGQPIERLPGPPEMIQALRTLGVASLGDFAALPSNAVVMRFGKLARKLQRLAAGLDDERVVAPGAIPTIRMQISFDGGETIRERLLWALERRLGQLYRRMVQSGLSAGALCLMLSLEGGATVHDKLPLEDPLVDLAHLRRLLRWHLETLELPAPVEELALELAELQWVEGRQLDLFAQRQEGDVRKFLGELGARWGAGSVARPYLLPSRRVEAAFAWTDPVPPAESVEVFEIRPRPVLRLLADPLPIKVLLEDQRPAWLVLGNQRERILAWAGPWRLGEGWWDTPLERDDYQLCTMAVAYYVVHDRIADSWSLLGAFD